MLYPTGETHKTIEGILTTSELLSGIITTKFRYFSAELEKMLERLKSESSYPTRRARSKFELLVFPDEGTEEYAFYEKVISAVQNWFTLFGWSKGPNPISIPHSLRRDVCKIQMAPSDEKLRQNLGKDIKTIYDLLLHLSGQLLPGISSSQSLPCDPIERVILVLHRVSAVEGDTESSAENSEHVPRISADPLSSNIYSSSERILLIWMNRNFEKTRTIVWKDSKKGDIPPTRWIVNFDKDLLDGLVLAAQVAKYCPYLISTHFVNMYTNPQTSEQCLHNCLILVNAFHAISLDIHVLVSGSKL
uniref:Calponin-homology (CH) domain-containing protein n=1 Tax=Podarcis muralis TaxID=64176 RepID=A0A670I3D1_PODMU